MLSAVLLLLATTVCITSAWPPAANGGWEDVTSEVFPPTVAYPTRPAALVDWNADQFIDMVVIGNGAGGFKSNAFAAYEWQDGNHSFSLAYESPGLLVAGTGAIDAIANIVVADFNRDGLNDVVALTASGALWVLEGASRAVVPIGSSMLPPAVDGTVSGIDPQLSAVNVFGRCALPDLVITTTIGALYVLRNTLADSGASCDFIGGGNLSFEPRRIDSNVVPLSVFTTDIQGTCNAQLLYGVQQATGLVTYRVFDDATGTSTDVLSVPDYAGIPAPMDINADGAIDLVFPFCTSSDASCRIGASDFSALLFVPNAVGGATCAQYDCCAGFLSSFSSVPVWAEKGDGYSVVSLSSLSGGSCPGLSTFPRLMPTNGAQSMPQVIRSGDYNRDSFRDLLTATNIGPVLLTRANGGALPPQFQCNQVPASVQAGGSVSRLVPFFFDLEEDGRLDIIMMDTQPVNNDALGLSAVWNGLSMNEDYFLTAVALNGVNIGGASASNPAPAGVGFPAFAATQVGAVHRFQWQDIDTNLRTQVASQQGASQAHTLQNPRVHFGLGRTFSYIQNYASGFHYSTGTATSASIGLSNTWSSSYLIPNSQVVMIPYPLDKPSQWILKLFLSASKYQTLLIIALSTALTVIGVPIIILKYREMKEDSAEMKRHA